MGYGGEGGIRTREKLAPLRDFQSRPFVHSGTSPTQGDSHAETEELVLPGLSDDNRHYRDGPAWLSTV